MSHDNAVVEVSPAGTALISANRQAGASAPAWLLQLPATIYVVMFLVLPLVMMFRLSLNKFDPTELYLQAITLENYVQFFKESFFREVLWQTFWISALTTTLCLVGGMPAAYFISHIRSPRAKSLLLLMIVLPLLMGNVVRTAGWMIVLDNRGVVNFLLMELGIIAEPLPLLYTPLAVVIGLTSVLLPIMIVTLHSVLEGIDPSLEEASLNLGASPLQTFRRVVAPLLMPGIFAGMMLCFILSMNAYATPVLLGGPSFHMMAPVVYDQITKSMNWPFGAALSFILMAVTIVLTTTSSLFFTRRTSV